MVNSPEFYKLYRKTYLKYKEIYGEKVCVFLLKGHFWEFYGTQDPITQEYEDTVKEITDLMGVKVTVYPNGAPNSKHGLFAGVPIMTLDKWGGRLTNMGWTVVVIEEIRDSKGAVSKREVTKILSPGTHIESAESSESFFLGSIWLSANSAESGKSPFFGAAAADLTTGQIYIYEGCTTGRPEAWYADDLRHFFQVYRPRELLVFWDGPLSFEPSQDMLKSYTYSVHSPIHLRTEKPSYLLSAFAREEFMKNLFSPKTSLPFRTWLGIQQTSSFSELALCRLLEFSEDHAPSLAKSLQKPHVWHPDTHLRIVNNALQQLNFISQDTIHVQQSVISLFSKPYTPMGKRTLSQRLCTPLANPHKILERLQQTQYLINLPTNLQKKLSDSLQSMHDLPRLHRAITRGNIDSEDILRLIQTYEAIALQETIFTIKDTPFEFSLIPNLVKDCIQTFDSIFDRERCMKKKDVPANFGTLQTCYGQRTSEVEAQIEELIQSANSWVASLSEKLNTSLEFKDITSETQPFMIQITNTQKKSIQTVLSGNKTDSLLSKITIKSLTSNARIEHSALDQFQEKLDSLQQSLKRIHTEELQKACLEYFEKTEHSWLSLETWVSEIDCTFAISKTATERGFIKPTIQIEGSSFVSIKGLRHPLIEAQKTRSQLVTHDVSLGSNAEQGWLLYGMNASGKSSLMKAIGIAVLLAQSGSYVPALSMEFHPFQSLATRILNQDNLWAGLSSFAVEMSELREIFSIADAHTLVLGDELCSGTESVSATAIVAAGIEWLMKANTKFVLATHLHDLMEIVPKEKNEKLGVYHLRVEYDRAKDRLFYYRDLHKGPGTTLYGLEVAKALHLPHDLLESAYSFRRKLLGSMSIGESSSSAWNSELKLQKCEVCGCASTDFLEVHHISERHNAIGGRNSDGTGLNDLRNLIIVCRTCHDKHHANKIQIGQVIDTSYGQERVVSTSETIINLSDEDSISESLTAKPHVAKKKSKWSESELEEMRKVISCNAGLSWKLMKHKMEPIGISITEKELKALRAKNLI